MNKSEKEYLESIIRDFDESDDKIEPLERLLHAVRLMVEK